jgi:hypothetical protein
MQRASIVAAAAGPLLAAAAAAPAAIVWNEAVNGDLSNNQAAPSAVTLSAGANTVIGNATGGPDTQDWLAVTVPGGFQLDSFKLVAYQSTDVQGFTGFQAGSAFVGSPFTAGSYAGYAHYGTAATNPPLATANLVGADLLPIMANPAVSAGATGFTIPLPAGTYTFLIQQLGASTDYTFEYGVSQTPAPSTLAILGLAAGAARRRRR